MKRRNRFFVLASIGRTLTASSLHDEAASPVK